MQIHELNTFTGTVDDNAYLAIDNGTDTSKINASDIVTPLLAPIESDMSVLEARMDSFTNLEEGSTTGDAELIDGRVGADGVTYTNIGGAIRSQVSDLKSDLTNITQNIVYQVTEKKGVYTNNDTTNLGKHTDADTNCAVISCSAGDVFQVSGEGWSSMRLWAFVGAESGGSYPVLERSEGGASADRVVITAPTGTNYLVVNFKRVPTTYAGLVMKNVSVDKRIADLTTETDTRFNRVDAGAIENIKNISNVFSPFTEGYWRVGSISPTTGANSTASDTISVDNTTFVGVNNGFTLVQALTGYTLELFAYAQDGTYEGVWAGESFEKAWSVSSLVNVFDLTRFPAYKFRIVLHHTGYNEMTKSEYTNCVFWQPRFATNGINTVLLNENLVDETTSVMGYLSTSGSVEETLETSRRETTTDFIPVTASAEYVASMFCNTDVEFWGRICFYDSDKVYKSRKDFYASSGTYLNYNFLRVKLTIPSNAVYVRISQRHGFSTLTKGVTEWGYNISPVDIRRHWALRSKQDYFVKSINHRGYERVAPENTAPAFELSADLGFWGVENDIRFTSDGVAVLMHDETINRTGRNADGTEISGTVNIADITYAQAQTYDFGIYKGAKYEGTHILSFEDFVKLCRKKSLHCYNEIKAGTEAQVKALVNTVVRNGMNDHTTWMSFSSTYLRYVLEAMPTARVGLVVSEITGETLTILESLKTSQNKVVVNVDYQNMPNDTTINSLIALGVELECYTPNTTSQITGLDTYVTGVISDWCIAGDALYTNVNNMLLFD